AQPLSQDVARLWCALAMRTNRAVEVLSCAANVYAHVEGDFYKAHWAHVLGSANFMMLDLPSAQNHFECSLNHLMALAKSGKVPPQKKNAETRQSGDNAFVSGKAEALLWKTCAQLAEQGIPAFPYAGTLLGLVRNNCL